MADSACTYLHRRESCVSSYQLQEVPNGIPVVGLLSFANGNCVVVVREDDGTYLVWDSKLGNESPIWRLTGEQFHKLGRSIVYAMRRRLSDMRPAVLSDGIIFAMEQVGRNEYVWRLNTGDDALTFTFDEIVAFYWGYSRGQFPEEGPLREVVSLVPRLASVACLRRLLMFVPRQAIAMRRGTNSSS